MKIIYYLKTSLDADSLIHVIINIFPLSMTYMNPLIVIHHRSEEFFEIYLKPLIGYGMMGLSIKYNIAVLKVRL